VLRNEGQVTVTNKHDFIILLSHSRQRINLSQGKVCKTRAFQNLVVSHIYLTCVVVV
jgi:hypothetical protein